nr:NAC domain-containing protein 41-like [Ipomoea batatas]
MKGSRINSTVGKSSGTWHGQDKGKPIIDKKTGALLGYKRSFLYQNKMEPEQDRKWLLKEFYLNDAVTETYPKLEHTKDFVLGRLQRKKIPGTEPQEIKDVPVETIVQILLHGAADSTATATATTTLPTIEENFDNHCYINPTVTVTTTLPTTEENFDNNYYINLTEDILAQVQPQPSVLGENNGGEQSLQGENNGDDMSLYFDCNILNEDPEMLAMQQRWLEGNDICIDDLTGPSLEEMLQELAAGPLPQPSMQASEKDASLFHRVELSANDIESSTWIKRSGLVSSVLKGLSKFSFVTACLYDKDPGVFISIVIAWCSYSSPKFKPAASRFVHCHSFESAVHTVGFRLVCRLRKHRRPDGFTEVRHCRNQAFQSIATRTKPEVRHHGPRNLLLSLSLVFTDQLVVVAPAAQEI